jgi:hypothetical protein
MKKLPKKSENYQARETQHLVQPRDGKARTGQSLIQDKRLSTFTNHSFRLLLLLP